MATVNKDFKIKSGLIVEGTTATVNGYDVLTKKQADQDYVVNLIGGTATSANEANKVVKRDENGNFAAGTVTVNRVNIGSVGYIEDDGSIEIVNTDEDDINLRADDIRLVAEDDVILTAGNLGDAGGDVVVQTSGGKIRLESSNVFVGTDSNFPDSDRVATRGYVDTAETDAVSTANSYTDGRETAITTAYQSYADTAEQDAKDYADGLINDSSSSSTEIWSAYKTSTEIGVAQAAAELHADNAVAALVDSAPALLDTLNELAAAIGDNPNYAADLATSVGTKVSKAGDTMTGLLVLSADPSESLGAATKQYVDQAETDANSYTDTEITDALLTAQGYATTAEQNAIAHADGLKTFDIEEDQNLYFTDARAKTSAADLLTGATLENITITGTGAGLTITAENGVADSTTDDLDEGTTNKYFTDIRVLDAITSNPIQPSSVQITWVRKEEATYTDVATASKVTCHSSGTDIGSMKYLVRVTANLAGAWHSHVTEVLATTNEANSVAVVEYGTIYTSEDPLATVTVEWNAATSEYDLNVTTANNDSQVLVAATLIDTRD